MADLFHLAVSSATSLQGSHGFRGWEDAALVVCQVKHDLKVLIFLSSDWP